MSIYCFVAKNAYCTCWKWWEFNKRPASNNHPPWVSAHSQGPKIHKRPRAIYWISKYKNWEDKNTICSKTWYIIRWVKSEEFFPSLFNWYVKLQYCLEVQHQQCNAQCVITLTIKNLLISPTWEWILYGFTKSTYFNLVAVRSVPIRSIRKLRIVGDFSAGFGEFISCVTHGPSSIVWRHVTVS